MRSFGAPDHAASSLYLTEAELTTLFCMTGAEAGQRALRALGLHRWHHPDETIEVGYQGLQRQGLVHFEGDRFTAIGPGETIARIAGTVDRVETFTYRGSNAQGVFMALLAAGAGLLVTVSPYGVHRVDPIRSDLAPFAVIRQLFDAVAHDVDCEFPLQVRASLPGPGEEAGHVVGALCTAPDEFELQAGERLASDEFWWRAAQG